MKKILLPLAIVLLAFSATAFETSIEPIEREASPGEQAVFQVDVFNNASEDRRFTLDYSFRNAGWIYFDSSRVIPAGETESFEITFRPSEDALQQSYSFTIFVTDFQTGETQRVSDYLRVTRDYSLNVQQVTLDEGEFMPGETVEASVTVQNILSRIVDDYSISSEFRSESVNANTEPLAPGAVKTYDFSYYIEEDAAPSTENLSLTVSHEDVDQVYTETVDIQEVRDVRRSQASEDKVLIVTGSRTVENRGNSPVSLTENVTFPSYLDPVLELSPDTTQVVEENGENMYIWEFELQPGEENEFTYQINYWIPLMLAAVIILGLAVLGRISGNIKVSKKTEKTGEGVKVSIEIKNGTEKYRPQLTVRDYVPNVAELDEEFEIAEPEVRKTTDGTKMEWTLEDFKPGERRVIQYNITPKVEVEEGIDLPSTEIIVEGEKVAESDS